MILSSASCTLTPLCPCKAEPCYNKIRGYTVARCCQTPSEFHLKDLLVFCSPADMIKLELQENPSAEAHMLYCSSYTDASKSMWTRSHSSLIFVLVCFLHLLSSVFKSMSFIALFFKVQINRALFHLEKQFQPFSPIRCFLSWMFLLSISDTSVCIWPRATASVPQSPR